MLQFDYALNQNMIKFVFKLAKHMTPVFANKSQYETWLINYHCYLLTFSCKHAVMLLFSCKNAVMLSFRIEQVFLKWLGREKRMKMWVDLLWPLTAHPSQFGVGLWKLPTWQLKRKLSNNFYSFCIGNTMTSSITSDENGNDLHRRDFRLRTLTEFNPIEWIEVVVLDEVGFVNSFKSFTLTSCSL